MKRTFIKALSLSLLVGSVVGCSKSDLITPPVGKELGFSTHVNSTTKGTVKSDFAIGDQFAVMATESAVTWSANDAVWYMGGGVGGALGSNYVTVTNSQRGNASAWTYSPIKLWPDVNKVSFFAFSPVATATNGIADVSAVTGSPTLKFTVSDDIKSQLDLLRAESLDKYDEEVQLPFSHALSRIAFAAKANVSPSQRVRLDKIELKGIKNSGSLKLYDDTRQIGSLSDMGGWSAQTGAANYTPALTHEVASLVTKELMPMTADDQALFMIPQEFTVGGGATLDVVYSYSNDGGKKWVNNAAFSIDLGNYTQYWNPSKSYRYVLTLSPDKVYNFSADIIDWNDELDVVVKNPFSVASLTIDQTGGLPTEFTVTETRGEALGYTLKSSDDTWLTISDVAAGTDDNGEIIYASDGSFTSKAGYEMDKKWFLVTKPNLTGAERTGTVTLTRAGMDDLEIPVKQSGFAPFKNVAALAADAYVTSPITKVEKMVVPNEAGLTHKLKASATWFKLSLDGVGEGLDEIAVVGNKENTPVDFYVHIPTSNRAQTAKTETIAFETTNAQGAKANIATYAVSQKANAEYFVGNFAGALKTETVGNETHYYFDKLLFAAAADEASKLTWGPPGATEATSVMDGKANTAKLNTTTYPAAFACWSKSSASTPANSFYLPATNQLLCMWIAKPVLGTFAEGNYWTSVENDSFTSWHAVFNNGSTGNYVKDVAYSVRCSREIDTDGAVANKVIKDAAGAVYIDVQDMPAGAFSTSTLNTITLSTDAGNSVYKKLQIAKADMAKMSWVTANGIEASYNTATAAGQTQGAANTGCKTYTEAGAASGWRVPTQRELMLMYIMKDALVQAGAAMFTEGNYWTSNESDIYNSRFVQFSSGNASSYDKPIASLVRCVREVN